MLRVDGNIDDQPTASVEAQHGMPYTAERLKERK